MVMLEQIQSPSDLKALSEKELGSLAEEIRQTIITTVSKNGGHLASNLGMVEATLVLHRIFSTPTDKILFDVGHQSYTHKLLTGRYDRFSTLRQYGGISGFENREESEHDALTEGHSGTSLSAALGIATAGSLQGKTDYTVAVVGDGALTNGMIYEALNNCADKKLRLVILINDNNMSISGNIGGLHNYLSKIRTGKRYLRFKHGLGKTLSKIPLLGKPLTVAFRGVKNFFKRLFVKNTLFEDLGISYLGPVNGHNFKQLTTVLQEAKRRETCCIVHILTQKGKGYPFAEQEPDKYHAVGAFDRERGVEGQSDGFSERAGALVCKLAERDEKICAITAAMRDGVGLKTFFEHFPDRFFDVGIAEEHAVTFAGGLAADGMKPVLFLYSTFAQRSYDQLLHDISIQKLPLTLMLDRCGLVPNDGITHQGIFDYPLFSAIPNVKIYAPATYRELQVSLERSLSDNCLSVVRYPKGEEQPSRAFKTEEFLSYTDGAEKADEVIVTYGRMGEIACRAAEKCGGKTGVVRLLRIFPLDFDRILQLTKSAKLVYLLEEGYETGGVAEKIAAYFLQSGRTVRTVIHAIPSFVGHGNLSALYESCGFTAEQIASRLKSALKGKLR